MSSTSPHVPLERRLGPFDGAAIVVSNVIGSGIFIVPIIIAAMVPHPMAMLGVWVVGGLLAFAGAMAYAELASLRPRSGAEYVYLREAFGPPLAFLTGWTSFVAGFSGAIAASAVGMASYLGRFIPAAGDTTPLLTLGPLTVSPQNVVALSAIAGLTVVHVCGLGPGRLVQNALAILKVAALVIFVALGFAIGRGAVEGLTAGAGAVPATGFVLALIPVMFSYSGWNAAAYVAEEVHDPGRNVPLALGLGTLAVVVIYLALNVLYLYAIPVGELRDLTAGIIDTTAERLFGFTVANAVGLFTVISILASISAMVLAGPRVYYAMAQDGIFFQGAARVHHRFRTPALAIVAQSLWSTVLVLSGDLAQLVSYTGFAIILFSTIAVISLFVLRWRHPREPRPFRAWGYPVAPALFVLAGVVMLGNEIWQNPGTTLRGLAVIATGIPLYLFWSRSGRLDTPSAGR